MKPASTLVRITFCAAIAFWHTGCNRKANQEGEEGSSKAQAEVRVNPLMTHASRFGIASRLPKATEYFFGTVNTKAHLDALEKTRYWKNVETLFADSKPKGEKDSDNPLKDFEVDDVFFAMSEGSAPALEWLMQVNRIYSRYTYRTLVTGLTMGAGNNSQALLGNMLSDPALVSEICDAAERVQLLPLLVGAKATDPEKLLAKLFPPDNPPEFLSGLTKGTTTTATGGKFTTYSGKFGIWLTELMQKDLVTLVSSAIQDASLVERVKGALAKVAATEFHLAYGSADGYAIMAAGPNLKHLEFAKTPQESLLANERFSVAADKTDKNLLAVLYGSEKALVAGKEEQPFTPLLKAALSGFSKTPMFAELAKQLEPKLEQLGVTEQAYFKYHFADLAAVFWWENGLRMESAGGFKPEGMILDAPLKLGPLLETPGAFVTAVGHAPAGSVGRAYFEAWMDLIYSVANGLVLKGLGGEQAQLAFAMAEQEIIPSLKEIYQASKVLYQKSLGTESAVVIDLQGQAPELPGVAPTDGPAGKFVPRITGVHELKDRPLLVQSWEKIEKSLNRSLKLIPMPLNLTPVSSDKNGVTTWFYALPMGGNDLMLCSSINDSVFMLGTSKNLNEELAARLALPTKAPLTGTHYRISFPALRTFLKALSSSPALGTAEQYSQALPLLEPFQELRGKTREEGGVLRHSLEWQIQDIKSFD